MASFIPDTPDAAPSGLTAAGLRLSAWFERWFPDAFSLALVTAIIVCCAGAAVSGQPLATAQWFGEGYWDLVVFTMQMAMIIVTGYALAAAPAVLRMIYRLANVPKGPRVAVAYVALFSMLSSLLSWSFSLVFSGLLARAVAERVDRVDYRALGAAAYLGVGSVWALGLSSSAALIMAAPASMPPALLKVGGVLPLTETLGLWQSMLVALCLIVASVIVAYASAPEGRDARTMSELGIPRQEPPRPTSAATPGERLEHSAILSLTVGAIGLVYLASTFLRDGWLALLNLNNYIFLFAVAALLLHGKPRSFVDAVAAGVPSVGGVLIQYPIYAGLIRVMTESGLAQQMAHLFVEISTRSTFPVLVGVYSALLGLFVPSAGGKWLIEAPYLLTAANELQAHLGWVVQTYNATEALANLIHPFWMLPLLGILGLKARDIVGYSMLQFIVHVPLVLFLVWILNFTLTYEPPQLP